MKLAVLVAACGVSISLAADARADVQGAPRGQRPAPPAPPSSEKVAEAYAQFLLGHRFEENEDETARDRRVQARDGARSDRGRHSGAARRAVSAAEQGAGGDGGRRAGAEDRAGQPRSQPRARHRLRGAVGEQPGSGGARPRRRPAPTTTSRRRFSTSRRALDGAVAEADPNVRATLARLYVRSSAYDKAIPLLTDLVNQEPGWQDGPLMLVEAYAGAGRSARRDRVARRADAPTIRGCCRRSPTSTSASGAGPTRPAPTRARCSARRATTDLKIALRLGADERRRPRRTSTKARDALDRGRRRARTHRCARALSAVAGAAPARRLQGGGSDGAPGHRAEQQEPVGLLRAGRSARGAPPVSGGRRRAGAGRRREPRQVGATRRSTSASCCRISGSPIRSSGSTTRRSRRSRKRASSSPDDPAVAGYLIEAQHRREEVRRGRRRGESGAGAASRTICG